MVQIPKMKYIIDTFKVLTLPFQLFVLFYMNQTQNTTMWVSYFPSHHGERSTLLCMGLMEYFGF
jgi:hypothetical protein